MAEGITVAGQVWPLLIPPWMPGAGMPIPVFSWQDGAEELGGRPVPEFRPGDGHNKRRVHAIRWGVWHWTGGEADPIDMAETLRRRKLGVELAIDIYGNAFQFCDPAEVDTADAGWLNAGSYGVEIVNYGFRSVIRARHVLLSKRAKARGTEVVRYRGRRRKIARFFPRQITTAVAVADAMCRALDIPRTVPQGHHGLRLDLIPREEIMAMPGGNVGHYMIARRKLDPGPTLMRELRDGLWRYEAN